MVSSDDAVMFWFGVLVWVFHITTLLHILLMGTLFRKKWLKWLGAVSRLCCFEAIVSAACATNCNITIDRVINAGSLSDHARTTLVRDLTYAGAAPAMPGDAHMCTEPGGEQLKHMEFFDCISWDGAIECYNCMRKVPEHWDWGIEEARSAVDRAIIHFQEQHDTLVFERVWQ